MKHWNNRVRSALTRRGHGRGWRRFGIIVLVLVSIAVVGRLFLPQVVRHYVNRILDSNPLYAGTIGDVGIHLWRGAYSIIEIQISKTTGSAPLPFFAAQRVDFAVQWNALFHRKLVGRVVMEQPEINIVDASSEGETQ